ncbi:muscle M-line assembly protein unc-89-like [Ptychodera flava]|uniref:muscle M-line assembly protein unc-89-like n=1 Tax=Ptychodera flava TaxID=63121 RepID=UPI00396A4B1D
MLQKLNLAPEEVSFELEIKPEEKPKPVEEVPEEEIPTVEEALEPPVFVRKPKEQEVEERQRVVFECEVTGSPRPEVTWYLDGIELESDDHYVIEYSESGICKLLIVEVNMDDEGEYEVKAVNKVGSDSCRTELFVMPAKCPPEFVVKPEDIQTVKEHPAEIRCKVKGIPKPTVTWYKGWKHCQEGKEYTVTYEKDTDEHVFIIKESKPKDGGKYVCKATNELGEAKATFTVTLVEKPPTPEPAPEPEPVIEEVEEVSQIVTVEEKVKEVTEEEAVITVPVIEEVVKEDAVTEVEMVVEKPVAEEPVEVAFEFERPRAKIEVEVEEEVTEQVEFKIRREDEVTEVDMAVEKPTEEEPVEVEFKLERPRAKVEVEVEEEVREEVEFKIKREDAVAEVEMVIEKPTEEEPVEVEFKLERPRAKVEVEVEEEVREEVEVKFKAPSERMTTEIIIEEEEEDVTEILLKPREKPEPVVVETKVEEIEEEMVSWLPMEPPQFVKKLSPITVEEGKPLQLEVEVTGVPKPSLTWYQDDEEVVPDEHLRVDIPKEMQSTLTIAVTEVADEADYSCKAVNPAGEAITRADVIIEPVREAPKFVKELVKIHITEGEPVRFECHVTGRPRPEVKWYKEETELEDSDLITIDYTDDNMCILRIKKTPVKFAGVYICKAVNSVGEAVTTAELTIEVGKRPPTFIVKPTDCEMPEGKPAEVKCSVIGNPEPTVGWFKGWKHCQQGPDYTVAYDEDKDEHTFVINDLKEKDAGKYTAKATNELGEAKATFAVSILRIPPKFVKELEKTEALEGTTVTLECKVTGIPRPEVQWFKKQKTKIIPTRKYNVEYTEDGVCTLKINDVSVEDIMDYTCKATNKVGQAETTAELELQVAAKITEGPASMSVKRGESVPLKCTFIGIPTPDAFWYRGKSEIETGDRFKVEIAEKLSVLTIRDIQPEDAGDYSFEVENKHAMDQHKLKITVLDKPSPPGKPDIDDIGRNTLLLSWQPPESDGGSAITAYAIEVRVVSTETWKVLATSHKTTTYEVEGLTADTPYVFRVRAKNAIGVSEPSPESDTVTTLQEPEPEKIEEPEEAPEEEELEAPKFVKKIQDTEAVVGTQTTFECIVTGKPEPDVIWCKDDEEIKPSDKVIMERDGDKYTLTLLDVKLDDDAEYTCRAKNKVGKAECAAEVLVETQEEVEGVPKEVAPYFIETPQKAHVMEGESVEFRCKVGGNPTPTVEWSKGWRKITDNKDFTVKHDEETDEYIMTIKATKTDDAGKYTAKISNKVGEDKAHASLMVDEKPEEEPEFVQVLKRRPSEAKKVEVPVEEEIDINELLKDVNPKDYEKVLMEHGIYDFRVILKHIEWLKQQQEEEMELPDLKPWEKEQVVEVVEAPTKLEEVKAAKPQVLALARETIPEDKEIPTFAFAKELADVEVAETDTAELTCEVTDEQASVTWLKDGKVIEPDDDRFVVKVEGRRRSLIVKDTTIHDEAEYTCQLGDLQTAAELLVEELKPVKAKVTIVEGLEDQSATAEQDVVFECEVSDETAEAKWFKDGVEIKPSDKYEIKVDGRRRSLTIRDIQPDDEADYTCKVEEEKTTAELVYKEQEKPAKKPVTFLKEIQSVKVQTKETATFFCEISDEKAVTKWYKSDAEIKPSKKYEIVNKGRQRSLLVHDVNTEDEDNYSVVVEESKCTAELIHERLTMVQELEDITVKEHTTATFECVLALPVQKSEVKWFVNKKPLKESNKIQIKVEGPKLQLILKDVLEDDQGEFCVTVRNVTSTAKMTVELPPFEITTGLKDRHAEESQTATFECRVSDNRAKVTWLKNGEPITPDDTKYKTVAQGPIRRLVISELTFDDIAEYTVVLQDKKSTAKLDVERAKEAPYFIEKPKFADVTEDALHLSVHRL